MPVTTEDLRAVFAASDEPNIEIGTVYPTDDIRGALYVDPMLSKHFAVLGSTGTGKSTSVALILHRISQLSPEGHIVMIDPHGVEISDGILYRALVTIPSQVPVGTYTAETFLIEPGADAKHSGKVVAVATRDIQIDKSGFERDVWLASQRHGFAYGLASVALSLGLGWAAAVAFRRRV
jgi:DNA helicase HerA-like ATPase